jgi:hypothetical protein
MAGMEKALDFQRATYVDTDRLGRTRRAASDMSGGEFCLGSAIVGA